MAFHHLSCSYSTNFYPIWLNDVTCVEKQLQHILSCDYNVTFSVQTEQGPCRTGEYLILKCGKTINYN